MKVGTDGVLLGAWSRVETSNHILDIGTGSGLIALMTAQRNPAAVIDAIDIDPAASEQATENAQASPFKERISVHPLSLEDFVAVAPKKYDHIISNPPFFSASLKCPDQQRSTARHTDTLSLAGLLTGSLQLLAENGYISLVLPYENLPEIERLIAGTTLAISRLTLVKPRPDTAPKRILVELKNGSVPNREKNELVIELERHIYSPEYTGLTREFYLKM